MTTTPLSGSLPNSGPGDGLWWKRLRQLPRAARIAKAMPGRKPLEKIATQNVSGKLDTGWLWGAKAAPCEPSSPAR
jgi:hypothetical protein